MYQPFAVKLLPYKSLIPDGFGAETPSKLTAADLRKYLERVRACCQHPLSLLDSHDWLMTNLLEQCANIALEFTNGDLLETIEASVRHDIRNLRETLAYGGDLRRSGSDLRLAHELLYGCADMLDVRGDSTNATQAARRSHEQTLTLLKSMPKAGSFKSLVKAVADCTPPTASDRTRTVRLTTLTCAEKAFDNMAKGQGSEAYETILNTLIHIYAADGWHGYLGRVMLALAVYEDACRNWGSAVAVTLQFNATTVIAKKQIRQHEPKFSRFGLPNHKGCIDDLAFSILGDLTIRSACARKPTDPDWSALSARLEAAIDPNRYEWLSRQAKGNKAAGSDLLQHHRRLEAEHVVHRQIMQLWARHGEAITAEYRNLREEIAKLTERRVAFATSLAETLASVVDCLSVVQAMRGGDMILRTTVHVEDMPGRTLFSPDGLRDCVAVYQDPYGAANTRAASLKVRRMDVRRLPEELTPTLRAKYKLGRSLRSYADAESAVAAATSCRKTQKALFGVRLSPIIVRTSSIAPSATPELYVEGAVPENCAV